MSHERAAQTRVHRTSLALMEGGQVREEAVPREGVLQAPWRHLSGFGGGLRFWEAVKEVPEASSGPPAHPKACRSPGT